MAVQTRISWLDSAKGIGIVLVVFGHVLLGLISADIIDASSLTTTVRSIIYSFHMPLFFIVAGAMFANAVTAKSSKSLLINRLCTIFYPYILWSILQGAIELATQNYKNSAVSGEQILSLLWEPRSHFWFLYELFIFSIIAIFIARKPWQIACIAAVGLALYCSGDWGNQWQTWRYFKHNLAFFFLGLLLALPLLNWRSNRTQFWLLGIAFAGLQYIFHIALGHYFLDKSLLSFALALISCAFVFALSQQIIGTRIGSLLALLGRHSLAIYLIHVLVLAATRIVLSRVFHVQDVWLHLLLATVLAIVLPLIISLLAERCRWPWLFRLPLRQ